MDAHVAEQIFFNHAINHILGFLECITLPQVFASFVL